MKAIRWLLKLVLVMITLPLLLAVWLAKWFVVFLHHCSAWFFYLLGSVLLATAVLSYLLQQSQGMEAFQMMIGWIRDFYDTAGARQYGGSSGTGGCNALAGVVHIRCPPRIACLWNCKNKKQHPHS